MPSQTKMSKCLAPVAIAFVATSLLSETPKLNIKTKHGLPMEEERKQHMERLAKQGDLSKYSITRDMVIERGAMNHSSPVLTPNLGFLNNDDLALSGYVHEQGYGHRPHKRALFEGLPPAFPKLDDERPEGDSEVRSSCFHIAVCMLEWQTMKELVGMEHARKVIEWEQTDHWASRAGRKYLELARSEVVSGAVRENEKQKNRP
jgi:hypothetical protein